MFTKQGIFKIVFEKSSKPWPDDVSAQCGGGEIDGIGDECFVEVFFKDFYVRGEGKTRKEAEESAWNKYQTYEKCTHEFVQKFKDKEIGVCKHCKMSKNNAFENTTCCTICQKIGVKNYIKEGPVCYKHYRENMKEEISKSEKIEYVNKLGWELDILEGLGLIEGKTEKEINEVQKLNRGFFDYMMMTCNVMCEKYNNQKHFVEIYEMIEVNEVVYKAAFKVYLKDNMNISIENVDKERKIFVEFFEKN